MTATVRVAVGVLDLGAAGWLAAMPSILAWRVRVMKSWLAGS